MDATAVLREIFPQVDSRIIRASVLEHKDDLQASIDFISTEVLEPQISADQFDLVFQEFGNKVCGSDTLELSQPGFFNTDVADDIHTELDEALDEKQAWLLDKVDDDRTEFQAEPDVSAAEESSLWNSASSSVYAVDSVVIEQLIKQTKSGKQLLLESIQEVNELRQKAVEVENAAEEAKAQAARGGEDLLAKAHEIRETLVRAKEANEMHSGEVYGEKAVLGTEAKELCARLHQVTEEWTNAYGILDESKIILQNRIDAAVEEARVADKERLEKEMVARQALSVEEEALAKVAQDSRELDAEADACTKLREFLIERGSVVDSLQGEIAILNEDVQLLRKKIDGLSVSDYVAAVEESFHALDRSWSSASMNRTATNSSLISADRNPTSSASSSLSQKSADSSWHLLETEEA